MGILKVLRNSRAIGWVAMLVLGIALGSRLGAQAVGTIARASATACPTPKPAAILSKFHPRGNLILMVQGSTDKETDTFTVRGPFKVSFVLVMRPGWSGGEGITIELYGPSGDLKQGVEVASPDVTDDPASQSVVQDSTIRRDDCSHGCYLDITGDGLYAIAVTQ